MKPSLPGCPPTPKVPMVCHNDDCSMKSNCVRYQRRKYHFSSLKHICKAPDYPWRIEVGSEWAVEFDKQFSRKHKHQNPFYVDHETRDEKGQLVIFCSFCQQVGVKHKIIEARTPDELRDKSYSIMDHYSHIRLCTGCSRWDGPWVPGYD